MSRTSTKLARIKIRAGSLLGWAVTSLRVSVPATAAVEVPTAIDRVTTNECLDNLSLGEWLGVPFDTVSTTSRRSQKIWEAPASVSGGFSIRMVAPLGSN